MIFFKKVVKCKIADRKNRFTLICTIAEFPLFVSHWMKGKKCQNETLHRIPMRQCIGYIIIPINIFYNISISILYKNENNFNLVYTAAIAYVYEQSSRIFRWELFENL